jgi:hypothetical protein
MKGLCFIVAVFILASCTDEERGHIKSKDPGVYAHYDIRAEEGSEMVTCFIRFYTDKTRKTTLTLEQPAKVELDGEVMPVDSSRFLGAYYELQRPVSDFEGRHTITFTSINNQKYKEEFSFTPLLLNSNLNRPITKTDLVLELEGLQPGDVIRIVMIDTAFKSEGVNQLDTVKNGQVIVEKSLLQTLRSGPVVLEISKESERSLVSGMRGMLTTTYNLRRDLVLKD